MFVIDFKRECMILALFKQHKKYDVWYFFSNGQLSFFFPPSFIKFVCNIFLGDQLAIAKETGRRLGMGTNMYPSSALLGQQKDESIAVLPLDDLIEKADGFASVLPGTIHQILNYASWMILKV